MSEKDNGAEENFNDDELRNIISEIENLEKEFNEQDDVQESVVAEVSEVSEKGPSEEISVEKAVADTLAAVEDISPEDVSKDDGKDHLREEVKEEIERDNTVSMDERRLEGPSSEISGESSGKSSGEVSFSGRGKVDFKMTFALGGQEAKLFVEEGNLRVSLLGTELLLSEEGCHVHMRGGAHFSVPLSPKDFDSEKEAA